MLMAYAKREGFRLGQVYVHDEAGGPAGALGALLMAAKHPQVTVVAVVSALELSRSLRVQALIRERLKQGAGVEIRVVGR
jgi:hypothetical protein